MAFNFPSSPSNGQIFNPLPGLYYRYVSASSMWETVPYAGTALPYNYVVNPGFEISQEYGFGSAYQLSGWHIADQWVFYQAPINMWASCMTSPSPNNSRGMIFAQTLTAKPALAVGDFSHTPIQYIEGRRVAAFKWGTSFAIQAILRFWLKSSRTGTYAVGIRNSAVNRSYAIPIVVTQTDWQEYSYVIPGDTAGTWLVDSGVGMHIVFSWFCGTNYCTAPSVWTAGNFHGVTGMSNGLEFTNQIFYLADVGLYLDPFKTGIAPKWEAVPEEVAIKDCQRYYWQCRSLYGASASTYGPARGRTLCPTPMRTAPGVSIGTVGGYPCYGWDIGAQNAMTTVGSYSNHYVIECDCNSATANYTTGRPNQQRMDLQGYLAISARM